MTVVAGVARAVGGSDAAVEGAAASAWLHAVVAGPSRRLRVTGVGDAACYLQIDDGDVIALEATGGVRLPNAAALDPRGPGLAGLVLDAPGEVGAGRVRVGSRTIVVRRWWDPWPRTGTPVSEDLAARRGSLPATATDAHRAFGLVAPIACLAGAATRRDRRALPRAVADLVGRGPGSTPAGDDVLAGLLATLRTFRTLADPEVVAFTDALGHESRRAAGRTTALSGTLLRCADRGAVVAAAGHVLRALAGHGAIGGAVAGLRRLGHTSGHDLLAGIAIGVDALTAGRGGP